MLQGVRIHINGIVQGVGFRPFVYNLAERHTLTGWVRNTSAGVDIEVDGLPQALESFVRALREEAPALAHIDNLEVTWHTPNGFSTFEILDSEAIQSAFQPISPDVCICEDCLQELFDPRDRRYRYPFINCTNCGPRFTIIQDIPYDRPNTTMSVFRMCAACETEYHDPRDRRFHAQPVACHTCGPRVWLELCEKPEQAVQGDEAILQARQLLLQGKILAVKGLGGFHLACDATNSQAVTELRRRKLRVDKPFALMMPDIKTVAMNCHLNPDEQAQIENRARPIVILERKLESQVVVEVAPRQHTIGVMLPYTPLHYLLFARPDSHPTVFDLPPLVMTSGNLAEEPICSSNEEARKRLAPLADAFLMHNREIFIRTDDSVVRSVIEVWPGKAEERSQEACYPVRRSRGYAPDPIRLVMEVPPLLAAGTELKNTFCLTRDRYAFLSHHIGDMENYETLSSFEKGVEHFERIFRVYPKAIAYDLHPDYLATQYALERASKEDLPAIGVQHHHAHIAACIADNSLTGDHPVIGVAFDGTGYGEDGAIWGGEFLVADFSRYERLVHLDYAPLPGGDRSTREPWRVALAWLAKTGLAWEENLPPVRFAASHSQPGFDALQALHHQLQTGLNAPLTSSMGRLFDALAALIGIRQVVNYEAQAAIELEALADKDDLEFYPLEFTGEILNPAPLFARAIQDIHHNVAIPNISARFHNGIAHAVLEICQDLRKRTQIDEIALSGGVWQNMLLLRRTIGLLEGSNFNVYTHHLVPTNDGGVSLGQALVAGVKIKG